MKSNFFRLIFFLYFFINIPKIYSNSFQKKKNHIKNIRLLNEADKFPTSINTIENNDTSVPETTFMTENPVTNSKKEILIIKKHIHKKAVLRAC